MARTTGWVLLEGLVPTDEIDAAAADLARDVPDARRRTTPIPTASANAGWGHRPNGPKRSCGPRRARVPPRAAHLAGAVSRSRARGALNRLCVHPNVVDFAERALQSIDIRLYQIHLSAKYAGETNYEQPMHTDRNHSWLPPQSSHRVLTPRDVPLPLRRARGQRADAPRAPRPTSGDRATTVLRRDAGGRPRACTRAELPAPGVRGSLLAYRSDVFHRGVDLTAPGTARFILALAFKLAGQDWIGYTTHQSKSSSPGWVEFARRDRRRASSSCSVSRRPVTRSGPPSCSTRPPRSTRNSTWSRGGDRYRDPVNAPAHQDSGDRSHRAAPPRRALRLRVRRRSRTRPSPRSPTPRPASSARAIARTACASVVRRIRERPRRPLLAPRRLRSAASATAARRSSGTPPSFGLIERRSTHLVIGEFSSKFAAVARSALRISTTRRCARPRPASGRQLPDHVDGDVYAYPHNETSTGVMVPVHRPDRSEALVVVDGTSGASGMRVDASAFDVYYFAPQKCFASDGGLWLALCSPRAIERIERLRSERPLDTADASTCRSRSRTRASTRPTTRPPWRRSSCSTTSSSGCSPTAASSSPPGRCDAARRHRLRLGRAARARRRRSWPTPSPAAT